MSFSEGACLSSKNWELLERDSPVGGGGGKEDRGIPGRDEEDEYGGQKVQGGVNEAQCGREEEEGKSFGGRERDGVPGMSSARDRTSALRMPLHCVSERGGSPPAPRRSLCTRGRR